MKINNNCLKKNYERLYLLKSTIVIITFLFSSYKTYTQNANITIGKYHSVKSEILQEERQIIVGLPQNYQPSNKTYSVVILLDGDYHFVSTYGTVEYLSKRFLMPESIVVAIPNTNRVRDLTPTRTTINFDGLEDSSLSQSGGASSFIKFIEDELLVWLNENYATDSLEIFIGHSWGGLTVTKSFLDKEHKFEKFLAIDPSYWWDNNHLTRLLSSYEQNDFSNNNRIFISASSLAIEKEKDNQAQHRNSINNFYNALSQSVRDTTQIAIRYFEDEDHASVPVPSTYYGLKFLFNDYYLKDVNNKSLEEITRHFREYYKRINSKIVKTIPEDLVRNVAQYKLYAINNQEEALEFFKYNVKHYPNSWKAHTSIGDAYLKMENPKKAKIHYERAVQLNPQNMHANSMLEKLED